MQSFIDNIVAAAGRNACKGRSILVDIVLGDNYHALITVMQRLTGMNWAQTLRFAGTAYLQNTKVSSKSFAKRQLIAVAHVRIGDSVRIDTEICPVILHGNMVYTSLSKYQQEI
jgi:hypothetical protein